MTLSGGPTEDTASWLIGTWQLLRCETPLEIQSGTRMHFAADERLDYAIPTPEGLFRVTMRWSLARGVLLTVHDDGSNPVEVGATLEAGDVLTFDFGGPRAWFVRAQ
ncbi:MAG: hypothetical protein H7099_15010 [Gemmatimonadaceae bacterium]|nr:hypothetical protein [Gemmatimonadaceae bacterium]